MISNEQIKQKIDYDSPDCCAFDMSRISTGESN